MPVEATLNAYPDWKIPGEVIAIIPTADRGKATVKVRVALNVRDPRIVPDMGVRVSFLEQRRSRRPAPAAARRAGAGGGDRARDGKDVVFVVATTRCERRDVKLGRTLGDDREVLPAWRAATRSCWIRRRSWPTARGAHRESGRGRRRKRTD